uniref:non-specific serine/threonine protein kinase n=1 Tax=Kalanchoe fedtschenkoi TaxID=63787 RepID=A0A7N0TI90_KALFE
MPGFVSLKCCANSNSIDKSTSINWTSDNNLFHSNLSRCQKITKLIPNYTGHNWARVFDPDLGKRWCYNLTTVKDHDYLVRGTFLYGDHFQASNPGWSYNVSIDVTPISTLRSNEDIEVEGIFRATKGYSEFCLVQLKGYLHISQLELRPLTDPKYTQEFPFGVSNLVGRYDLGNQGELVRYPEDPSDRKWSRPADTPVNSSDISTTASNLSISSVSVPLRVLQTALAHSDRLEFIHDDLDAGNFEYLIFFYFFEFNTRPICNAYEILQIRQWDQESKPNETNTVIGVRNELLLANKGSELLESWSGDPCLPFPWEGLTCQLIEGSAAITALDLSFRNLAGPVPVSITQLNFLTKLNLSNNFFTGMIPDFPATSMLTTLDLRSNDLSGSFDGSLSSLNHLKELFYGCNQHLSAHLANKNDSTLISDYGKCGSPPAGSSRIVIGTVACGSFLFTVLLGISCVYFHKKKLMTCLTFNGRGHPKAKNSIYSVRNLDDIIFESISVQRFTQECVELATQNYKIMIGEGGFGSVYRGTLTDGQEVAVKVRSATSTQGTREFENELNLLSDIRHENLVPLLGYCWEKDQQMLVYPFMSNGSLQDRLYGEAAKRKVLDWPTRISIALGAARGLTYLHSYAGRCIIHRDVKSSNILLDHSMCAKVADFGFSKYAPQEGESAASLEVRGTAGYLDPEYYSTQHLSAKSDVFSFGVVLLEIVTGREPLNIQRPRNEWSLVEWAKPYIREQNIDELVDPNIRGGYHSEAMYRVVEVALACTEPYGAYRPAMADVVRELEDAFIIENNASEYMRSIDSFGGSNRYSIVIERRILSPIAPSPPDSTLISPQATTPEPR